MLRGLAWVNLAYQLFLLVVLVVGYASMGEERKNSLAKVAYYTVILAVILSSVLSLGVIKW